MRPTMREESRIRKIIVKIVPTFGAPHIFSVMMREPMKKARP